MACFSCNGRLNRLVITVAFSLALVLGANINIANAANRSTADKTSTSLEQTTPNGVITEGEEPQANMLLTKPIEGKPSTVSGVAVNVVSAKQLDLTWNEVSGATSYKIYRSKKQTDEYKRIGFSTTASFSDDSVKANTVYYYQVSAVNEVGEGRKSNEVYGATKLPVVVTNMIVAVINENQLDISWKAVKGVGSYEIYRSSSSSSKDYKHIGTSTTASFSDTDLASDTTYYYKLSAVNGVGEGKQTKAFLGETKAPKQVTGLSVKVISDDRLDLSWKAVSGAESYMIYRSKTSYGDFELVDTSETTSYSDKGLRYSTKYYYQVSAVNVIGEGPMSSKVSRQTKD